MMKNTKAVSTTLLVLIVIIIIVAVVIGIAASIGSEPTVTSDVTVYIDTVQQTGNYTQPQTLEWGNVIAGNVYTKNFTVTNTGAQNLTLMLLTTEPLGTIQTWAYNNSLLAPNTYAQGSLTLTLSTSPSTGAYTWRLLATNNTAAQPTPTPTQTAETPTEKQFTLKLDPNYGMGIKNITVQINTDKFTIMPTDFDLGNTPTYSFMSGDTLSFKANAQDGYIFDSWMLNETIPKSSNPLIMQNQQENVTLTARFFLVTEEV